MNKESRDVKLTEISLVPLLPSLSFKSSLGKCDQKLGQSILLQLVKVYFQWIDLCGLFHVRDGLQTKIR